LEKKLDILLSAPLSVLIEEVLGVRAVPGISIPDFVSQLWE